MAGAITLLGPQRSNPNLPRALDDLAPKGPIVLLSAGWRHDEGDVRALRDALDRPVTHLPLYAWLEALEPEHPQLLVRHRRTRTRLAGLKELYRARLGYQMGALQDLWSHREARPLLASAEIDDALAGLRALDARFQSRADDLRVLEASEVLGDHPKVHARREEVRRVLEGAGAVLIAGGHVGVLRSRLAAFGVDALLREAHAAGTPIVAWSGGAMVLSERIVLFYDDPPDGPSYPEIHDRGVGLVRHAVLFPHARTRLRLDDTRRVALLAARFAPAACLTLEHGARLDLIDGRWICRSRDNDAVGLLMPDGSVRGLEVGHAAPV